MEELGKSLPGHETESCVEAAEEADVEIQCQSVWAEMRKLALQPQWDLQRSPATGTHLLSAPWIRPGRPLSL